MNNDDIANALRSLADNISPRATPTDPPPATAPVTPPGMVAVSPTGPHGAGITRYWPTPYPGEGVINYETRCMNMTNPATGKTFWPSGRWGAGILYEGNDTLPVILDRLTYPDQWMDQQELDRQAALAARDAGRPFSPG